VELHLGYALVGALAVLVAFFTTRIRELPVSEPLLALLLGVLVGPVALNVVDVGDEHRAPLFLEASRVLLAVALMAVALRFPLRDLRPLLRPGAVLVVVAMLGMAAISTGLVALVLGLPLALAALAGACITPTDPVLASSVVSGGPAERDLPARIRQLLSVESGSNDGLAYVLVVLTLSIVLHHRLAGAFGHVAYAVLAAVGIGVVLGEAAGRAMNRSAKRQELDSGTLFVFTIVLAVAALGIARVARTDGVLAVFVTGLAYNRVLSQGEREPEQSIDESLNRYLVLPLFFLLGVELPWREWIELGWSGVGFAVAVLLLRRLPVLLALVPVLGLRLRDGVFLGWFGPMGVSAVFYLAHAEHQGVADPRLWAVGSLAVAASTLAHGVTSAPGRRLYARSSRRARRRAGSPRDSDRT
jgi:NhaP-type Na+/H+ or K+/H+ antiporter